MQNDNLKLKSVEKMDPRGKRMLVRVDWNVTLGNPFDDAQGYRVLQVVDDTRIRRTEKTIRYLLDGGAMQVVLCSHLGKAEEGKSIEPVVDYSGKLLSEEIAFCKTVSQCHDATSQLVMLENLRFWPGEESNNAEFARELARLGEVYVNEAFGECHREVASIVGVAKLLSSYAGFNLVEEVKRIRGAMENPKRPLVVIMGGAKVEDKIKLLAVLSTKADTLLLGGKLANEFVQRGVKLEGGAKVVVPFEGDDLLDIGEETQRVFVEEIARAGTVVWNGPMGKVEEEEYRAGTHAVYEALMANEPAEVIVGGGDTLTAIRDEKHLERIDWVSTGGGAMLKLIEKGTLPGLEVLRDAR